jgi:hypothetical protein
VRGESSRGAGGGRGRGAAECAASFVDRGQLDMSSIRMGCRKAGSPPPAPFVDCRHVASLSVWMERETMKKFEDTAKTRFC